MKLNKKEKIHFGTSNGANFLMISQLVSSI